VSEIRHIPLGEATIPSDGSIPQPKLVDLPFEQVTRDIRLYYELMDRNESAASPDKRVGFRFYAARYVSAHPTREQFNETDSWAMDGVEIEGVFHGTVYYDGLRHLYMGDERSDNEGYLYYADVRDLIKVFETLDAMEQKYLEPEFHSRV
jgi:hypothetical protein